MIRMTEALGIGPKASFFMADCPASSSLYSFFTSSKFLDTNASSTDTCLINASTIFAKDIAKKESVTAVRITVAVIGVLAAGLAILGNGDIMTLLTGAYSIYTPGVIFPLLIAILCYKKKRIRKPVWLLAVSLGGLFGIVGTYFSDWLISLELPAQIMSNLTLIGMGLSLIISILSIDFKSSTKTSDESKESVSE